MCSPQSENFNCRLLNLEIRETNISIPLDYRLSAQEKKLILLDVVRSSFPDLIRSS